MTPEEWKKVRTKGRDPKGHWSAAASLQFIFLGVFVALFAGVLITTKSGRIDGPPWTEVRSDDLPRPPHPARPAAPHRSDTEPRASSSRRG